MAEVDTTVFDKVKSLRDFQDEYALNAAKIAKLAEGGGEGHDPAAVKIVNEMQLAAAKANDQTADPATRAVAAHRYNLLNQVAKSYAIDRGMNAEVPSFYGSQPAAAAPVPAGSLPAPAAGADPQQEFSDALAGLDAQGALSPATGAIPRKTPMPLPAAAPAGGVSEIPGFAATSGNIAATKKGMETQAQKDVELQMNPKIQAETSRMGETGKAQGEAENKTKDMLAQAPRTAEVYNKLSSLADSATYTTSGKIYNSAMRQFGVDLPQSGVDREAYVSTANNSILPLLRQTFGAQFTDAEGKRLIATLGDPDKSPTEKHAALDGFIQTQLGNLQTAQRRAGVEVTNPYSDIAATDKGAMNGAPLSGAQEAAKHIFTLQKNGVSKSEAEEYLRLKGVIK